MPWDVHMTDACPAGRPWAVRNTDNGHIHGCHPSRNAAVQQQRALYASENTARVGDMSFKIGPAVQVKVVDESKGEIEAVFSTLNVKDKDGDVTLPGAFGEQNVRISAYNHSSWQNAMPIGKGTIREVGNEAILKGQFFMDVTNAKDTFNTIKALGELMEWSYGYDILDRDSGTWPQGDAKGDGEDVQFLKKLKVHEVSPVILGAGENTRTLSAKNADNKGAIAYSETGTTDVNWDSGLMTRRVAAAQSPLRAMHAWVNTLGQPDAKTSYKFPHHMVSDNGAVGAANTRACLAGIAVLNGGRGGANIPDSDRQGVYLHLAHHMRDAGKEAPPLKSWTEYREARKEYRKQNMTVEQRDAAMTILRQMMQMLGDDSLPPISDFDDLIDSLEEAIGVSEPETESADFSGGMKLFDQLAVVYSGLEGATNRVAEAVAMRAEKGERLAEQTMEVVELMISECDRLREAVAIQPRKSNPNHELLVQSIFRDSSALLALTRGVEA